MCDWAACEIASVVVMPVVRLRAQLNFAASQILVSNGIFA